MPCSATSSAPWCAFAEFLNVSEAVYAHAHGGTLLTLVGGEPVPIARVDSSVQALRLVVSTNSRSARK